MNSRQAIDRIMKILNLVPSKFMDMKTEQGIQLKMEGELEVGAPIYVATEEGMIPAPDGTHKLEDGSEIEVLDGKISKIKMGDMESDVEKEEEKEMEDTKDESMSSVSLEFGDVKLKGGKILRVGGEKPSIGLQVKMVNYDGTLDAAVDGSYETEGGEVISILGGAISGVQSKKDYEARGGKFTVAETAQGVKVESPTFDVGEEVMVLGEDGEKSPAPDGEHQVVLKDSSGNENKIRFITKDGKITERENVEEKMSAEEIAELFASALKKIEDKIDAVSNKQNELETKFGKFSKEPAGSKVYDQKTTSLETFKNETKFEGFKRLREALSQKN